MRTCPRSYKTPFMRNPTEHEASTAHKNLNYMLIGKLYIKVMPFKIDTCSNGNLPSLSNSCSCPFGGNMTSFH